MKSLIFLLLFNLVISSESAKSKPNAKCNESVRQRIDKQFASVVPILNGVKLPENEKQLQKYCTAMSAPVDSAFGYLRSCGGTFGPFMAKFGQNEYKKGFDLICKSKDSEMVAELLSAGRCVNSVATKLEKCANYMIDSLMALKSVSVEDKMNTACCQSHKLFSCTMRALIKSKKCEKDLIQKIQREVLLTVGQTCEPYFGDTNKCNKMIAKVPKFDNSYVRPKSLFIPLMTVMDSYRNMKCSARTEQTMDSTIAKLITIGTPEKIPENSVQMNEWCTMAIRSSPYFYGYIESCLSDFGKFLTKVMAGAVATNFEPYCTPQGIRALENPNPEMREYIKAAKCGNKAEDKLKVCFDDFNENVLAISEAPEMSRIKMACCNAYNFRTCIFNATTSTAGCSLKTVQWAEQMVMQNAGEAINLVCADHWGGPKCDKLLPLIPKLDKTKYIAPKSPFFPMIKLLDSFPDVDLNK